MKKIVGDDMFPCRRKTEREIRSASSGKPIARCTASRICGAPAARRMRAS
jgi:hypothetical protein